MVVKRRVLVLALTSEVISLLLLSAARPIGPSAQRIEARPHRHQPRSAPVLGWDQPQVIACLYVAEPGRGRTPNRIAVIQNPVNSRGALFEVQFLVGWPGSPKTVFVHPESITFSDIFWVTKDVVASEWVGGDRPVVEVFHLVENGARMVFNEGARAGFEFWHTTILLNDAAMGTDGNYQATTTQIWKWDGNQYKLVTTVPYNRRIEALAKLSDEVDR